MNAGLIIWILAVIFGIAGIVVLMKREGISYRNKVIASIFLFAIGIFFVILQLGALSGIGLSPLSAATQDVGGGGVGTVCGNGICEVGETSSNCVRDCPKGGETYQPTASYAAKDKYSIFAVSGTSYYKANGLPATTTAKTNVKVGETYDYWVSNATYYCKPYTFTATAGANDIVATCYANGTATITGYDLVGKKAITTGANNITIAANGQANVEITYQGTAKASAGPFGGVVVVEYNSTFSSVVATGAQILSKSDNHLTYTVSATTHTYKVFPYSSEMDDGSGSVRTVNLQFTSGATAAGTDSPWYVKFIPANYYVSNSGTLELDTEKFANQDTTRTGLNPQGLLLTAYWA